MTPEKFLYSPENIQERVFIFVGERRSITAQRKGWSWESCQKSEPRLCAIQLWNALSAIGIDPKIQIFINAWDDDGKPNQYLPEVLQLDLPIVAMGKKVHEYLNRVGVKHIVIPHPAARGKIRNSKNYIEAVAELFKTIE